MPPREEGSEHNGTSLLATTCLCPSVTADQAGARTQHTLKTGAPSASGAWLSLLSYLQSEPDRVPSVSAGHKCLLRHLGHLARLQGGQGPPAPGGPAHSGAPTPLQPHPHTSHTCPQVAPPQGYSQVTARGLPILSSLQRHSPRWTLAVEVRLDVNILSILSSTKFAPNRSKLIKLGLE